MENQEEKEDGTSTLVKLGVNERKGREFGKIFFICLMTDLCNKEVKEAVSRRTYAIYCRLENEVKR